MKLRAILKEVTDRQSREMVTGIADILRQVRDDANREGIAKRMMRKFDIEGVKYDAKEFMRLANVAIAPLNTNQNHVYDVVPNETEVQRIAAENRLQEIGETTAKPYLLTKLDESVYYVTWGFKTDSGIEYKIVIGKNFRGEDPDSDEERDENELEFLVSFGVVSRGTVDFEAEFKDVKNLFRVMATVIKAVKITIEDEEDESGIPVTKIVIEPTKREINTPGSAGPVYDKSDTRRADLYMRFIQKQMPPGAKVRSTADKGRIEILLPTE